MRLTNQQLAILRQKPQSTHLYLSIFQPVAIFKAQVNNASAARGDRVITFDSVSLGLYTYIQNGMTMWVGSTPGANDIGKVRVRSATSTQITVSENSNIAWADNLYLTIFNYFELWPVYPRIIQDPSNAENVIFYKDYDIAYSNQNSILGTFVNAGPHRAVLLDPASNQAQIYYSSTGSYNLLGDSLNYNWFFEGATVTGSSAAVPGYITYNTPGQYVTRLTISGSSGGIDTTYRYVSVYNQANPPIQKWQLQSLQGSRDEGGYSASIKVFEIIPIQEHAVVVIFGDSFYGATQTNLGGNFPNASDIFYVGYVDKDSIQYDYEHSEVSFDAVSLTEIMKKSSGFSVSVQSVASPTKWYELLDMDSQRALYHYLRWHTTALNIEDFQFVGDNNKVQFFDSDRESMYDAINNYMQNSLLGNTVSDRQGKVWMEQDAMTYQNPTGSFPSVLNISKNDWMNTPNIDERLTADVSYMEYGGVHYSGVITGTFTAMIAAAPGNAPGFYGTLDEHQGLVLSGQPRLNQTLGNIFANKNSQYPSLRLDMSLNASNLDIAPQETTEVHITPQDTVRNITLDGLYIPDSFTWRYDPKDYILLPQIDYKQLVNGGLAETVTIPSVSDVGGGFEFDPFSLNFPPLPSSYPPTTSDVGDGAPARILIHDQTYGLLMTNTFNTPNPQWFQINGGLTQTQYRLINKVVVCPNGAIYAGYIFGPMSASTDVFLARAAFAGAPFVIIEDYASISAKYGGSTNNIGITAFNCNRGVGESVLYALSQAGDNTKTYIGSNTTFVAAASFTLNNNNGADISYGNNSWLYTANSVGKLLGPLAAAVTSTITISSTNTTTTRHLRIGTGGNTIHWSDTSLGTGNALALGTNNLGSIINKVGNDLDSIYQAVDKLASDSSGIFLCSRNASGPNPYKSSDGGYSWSTIGNLPVLTNCYFACPGESNKWIFVSSYIYYTDTFWNTSPVDKRGNLLTISPIPILDVVKILP